MTTATESIEQKVQALLQKGDDDAYHQLLVIMLEERHEQLRNRILRAIDENAKTDLVAMLIGALRNPSRTVRTAAIELLGEQGDPRAVERLMEMLHAGDSTILRLKAAEALGKIGDPRATDGLLSTLQDSSASVRIISAEALGKIGDPRAVAPLVAAMMEGNTLLRRPSVDALGNIGDARALEPLMDRLGDNVWDVQWSAAEALGKIGGPKAAGALVNWSHRLFLSEENPLSEEEKRHLVREIMTEFFHKLPDGELRALQAKIQSSVRMRCWEVVNADTEEGGWVDVECENPVMEAIKTELGHRGTGSTKIEAIAQASAAAEDPNRQTRDLPKPQGAVAAFLEFLRERKLDFAALIGGAVRATALGEEAEDLDVAFLGRRPDSLSGKDIDPIEWNIELSAQTHEPLKHLAQALECPIADLINGEAKFRHDGREIPVHYVGPYYIEEQETSFGDRQIEQRIKRTLSRYGFLADFGAIQLHGLVPTTTFDQMWLDTAGRWGGRHPLGRRHLAAREVHTAGATPLGINSIFRVLFLKRSIGGVLGDTAAAALEAAAARIAENPEEARREFSRAAFDRLYAAGSIDALAQELSLLGLIPALSESLDVDQLAEINGVLQKGEAERESRLAGARAEAEAKRGEADALKQAFDAKRREFAKCADSLDVSKNTKNDLDERLQRETAKLAAADQAAREATAKLEEVTRRFRRFTEGEDVDTSVLREHRETLALKREKDAEVARLREDVDGLRTAVAKRQEGMFELQDSLERLGGELEKSMEGFQSAQSAAAEAQRALDAIEADLAPSPEERRRRLCAAGAPA